MTRDEKAFLLEVAKQSIKRAVRNEPVEIPSSSASVMKEKRGAFVTLEKNGSLRGCIGFVEAYKPLVETVSEMAVAAAMQDPRFPEVSADEVGSIEIEISVLSPFRIIKKPDEIAVGKDGLLIKKGFNSGLLLPQVALRYKWDSITFLEQTCIKAGLESNDWKEDSEIYAFTAEVFSEKEISS